ncbi:S-phase kinase-associated protein 1a, partial [Globisporangium splendens]
MSDAATTTPLDGRKVKLVSMEGQSYEVDAAVASLSKLVSTLVSDDADEDDVQEVPLPNVKKHVLEKVVAFCEHHHVHPMKELEKPLKSNDLRDAVSDWYADFVEVKQEDQELLFELILAANYLDIKSLLDLACAKVATMIKGKTPEEIRATFGITEEFTPEEEQRIREENKWCEDI